MYVQATGQHDVYVLISDAGGEQRFALCKIASIATLKQVLDVLG